MAIRRPSHSLSVPPFVGDIDERVGLKADGVPWAVVVLIDSLRRAERAAGRQQAIAMAKGRLGELRGDLVIGVAVVRP